MFETVEAILVVSRLALFFLSSFLRFEFLAFLLLFFCVGAFGLVEHLM